MVIVVDEFPKSSGEFNRSMQQGVDGAIQRVAARAPGKVLSSQEFTSPFDPRVVPQNIQKEVIVREES